MTEKKDKKSAGPEDIVFTGEERSQLILAYGGMAGGGAKDIEEGAPLLERIMFTDEEIALDGINVVRRGRQILGIAIQDEEKDYTISLTPLEKKALLAAVNMHRGWRMWDAELVMALKRKLEE